MKKIIRIANAGGFWGDDLTAFRRQLEGGPVDYISIDFLAEITMSILKKQQVKNAKAGFVTDFVNQILENAHLLKEKKVKVIANAGGINPLQCGREIVAGLKQQGIALKVAVITGDNIVDRIEELYGNEIPFTNMETGESFDLIKDRVQSANVYIGLPPLVEALRQGADIIVAGRVTDTSVTMAPMVYEFGWELDDWDKLAAGVVAGHIIECGAQSGGGNFSDWKNIPSWSNFGYPIVEVAPNGEFIITKHPGSGGLITVNSVKEQLLYEMGDPKYYISPDVVADFTTIHLREDGPNRVYVSGVKGKPSTPFFKVSIAYRDGYKASGALIISGPDTLKKAEIFEKMFWERVNETFEKTLTEKIGANACHGDLAVLQDDPPEIMLRFAAYDHDKSKFDAFAKQLAPLILSGPPGVAVTGGRPRVQEVMAYWPALMPKKVIKTEVHVLDERNRVEKARIQEAIYGFEKHLSGSTDRSDKWTSNDRKKILAADGVELRFYDICLARSGDKGDMANLGVVARNEIVYNWLKQYLTPGVMKNFFAHFCHGSVTRFEVPNLLAFNFLLDRSLDGGGTKALRTDAQGKTFAQAFLAIKIKVPQKIAASVI